ncbi:MAG: YlmH/Sll1252 family protein [Mycoplasmatales bacterium]
MLNIKKFTSNQPKEYQQFTKDIFSKIKVISISQEEQFFGFFNQVEYNIIERLIQEFSDLKLEVINNSSDVFALIILINKLVVSEKNYYDETLDLETNCFTIMYIELSYKKNYFEIKHPHVLGTLLNGYLDVHELGEIRLTEGKIQIQVSPTGYMKLINQVVHINKQKMKVKALKAFTVDELEFDVLKISVNSMRADLIVKQLIRKNRDIAKKLISNQDVTINNVICRKNDQQIKSLSTIAIRRYGKFIITDEKQMAKNIQLTIKKLK